MLLLLLPLSFSIVTSVYNVTPQSKKTQYVHFRSHAEYLLLPWKIPEEIRKTINVLPSLKGVSTISNICTYNLLALKWIEQKFDVYINGSEYYVLY